MSEFRITAVNETREFDTQHGPMVAYKVAFEGDQGKGEAEIKQKTSTAPPEPGEVIDAEIKHGRFGPELKKSWKPGPNGKAGGKGGDFRTPQQIMRSDAHGKTMHWCDIKVAAGEWKPITWEQYIAMVDRYYDDIKAAS